MSSAFVSWTIVLAFLEIAAELIVWLVIDWLTRPAPTSRAPQR